VKVVGKERRHLSWQRGLLPSYGLRQVVAQGRYRAIVDLAAGNAWRMQGPTAQAIKLDPSPLP